MRNDLSTTKDSRRAVALRQEQDTARRRWICSTAFTLAVCFAPRRFWNECVCRGQFSSGSSGKTSASVSAEMREAEILVKRESLCRGACPVEKRKWPPTQTVGRLESAWLQRGSKGDYAIRNSYDRPLAIEPGHKRTANIGVNSILRLADVLRRGTEMLLGKHRKLCNFNCGEVKDLEAIMTYKKTSGR